MAELFKIIVVAFEALGVAVLIVGFMLSMGHFIKRIPRVTERHEAFRELRQDFGHTLLLSLDLLVAADIVLTITLKLSLETLGMLGLLVLIRTFLHFFLELEVSGHWPWQGSPRASGEQVWRQRPSESAKKPGAFPRVTRTRRIAAMDNVIILGFVTLTIFSLMFAIGLNHSFEQLTFLWSRTALLLRSLLAVIILVPVVVGLLLRLFDLPPSVATGLAVLAAAPGAPLMIKRAEMAGGASSYAASLQLTLALLAVLVTPLVLATRGGLFELTSGRVTSLHCN